MTKTVTVSVTLSQAPAGSSVVSVKLIFPTKPVLGVKIAFKSLSFEKTPETSALHVADEAAPPIDPAS